MPNLSETSKRKTLTLDSDKISDEQFRKTSKIVVNQIKNFNAQYSQFLELGKKTAKELCNYIEMYKNVDT